MSLGRDNPEPGHPTWEQVLEAWTEATNGDGTRIDLRGSRWPKARAVNYLSKYASNVEKLAGL